MIRALGVALLLLSGVVAYSKPRSFNQDKLKFQTKLWGSMGVKLTSKQKSDILKNGKTQLTKKQEATLDQHEKSGQLPGPLKNLDLRF